MDSVPQPRRPKGLSGGRVARIAPLAGLAGRTVGEAVVASLRQRRHGPEGDDAWRPFHERNAERYAEWMGRSRGLLLKAAQIMSVVLPDAAVGDDLRGIYRAAFVRLLDEVPPMPIDTVHEVLAAELGPRWAESFSEFQPVPVGSASIGQVHEATLRDGRRVAVKVQYPGVGEVIRSDLRNTELLGTFLRLMLSMMPGVAGSWDTKAIAREITDRITEEIDYRIEAKNHNEFAEAYRGHPFIRIPDLVPELCTERVLGMDFVEGLRYAVAAEVDDAGLRDRWGEVIFRFGFGGLRTLRFGNADANPGNFIFHADGTVTFLDFGCVTRHSEQRLRGMFGFLKLAADGDAEGLHRWTSDVGHVAAHQLPAPETVLAFYREAYSWLFTDEPFTATPEYFSRAMRTRLDRNGEFAGITRAMVMSPDMTMVTRLDTATLGLLGGLHATAPWRAIFDEYELGTAPATPYGELDTAYRAAHR